MTRILRVCSILLALVICSSALSARILELQSSRVTSASSNFHRSDRLNGKGGCRCDVLRKLDQSRAGFLDLTRAAAPTQRPKLTAQRSTACWWTFGVVGSIL